MIRGHLECLRGEVPLAALAAAQHLPAVLRPELLGRGLGHPGVELDHLGRGRRDHQVAQLRLAGVGGGAASGFV